MRVASLAPAGFLSALAPLLIKETGFFTWELRQAPERQELARKSTGPLVFGPESEVAALGRRGARVVVAHVLAVILRTCALPVFDKEYVRAYESDVARVVSW